MEGAAWATIASQGVMVVGLLYFLLKEGKRRLRRGGQVEKGDGVKRAQGGEAVGGVAEGRGREAEGRGVEVGDNVMREQGGQMGGIGAEGGGSVAEVGGAVDDAEVTRLVGRAKAAATAAGDDENVVELPWLDRIPIRIPAAATAWASTRPILSATYAVLVCEPWSVSRFVSSL